MPAEDVNRRKERVINEARKVVENINAMSFVNLDDQQVHSLMTMREIARGVVNNKVTKITKSDVKKALSSSIDKMVLSCKDVNTILSRIPCDGMDEEQFQSVSRMKEIASTIVTRRAKVSSSRLLEPAYRSTAETVESKMGLMTDNKEMEMGGLQRRLFESENDPVGRIEIDQSEGQDIIMIDASIPGNGSIQDMAVNGGSGLQIALTEGMMFDDVELVVETDLDDQAIVNGMSEPINDTSQNKAKKLALVSPLRLSVVWPYDGRITLEWVKDMMAKFELSSKKDPPSEFWTLMASEVVDKLITAASSILSSEQNCVEVNCQEGQSVVVVGDVEGQFHDLLNIFRVAGLPSEELLYVFNGNYVDRGAWGLEAFLVLLALKVLMPNRVYLLRGNHETKFCTTMFGFEQEVKTKFGEDGEMVYQKCLECFKELPLASIISKCVYTTHGGLFRSTRVGPSQSSKRKRASNVDLGSLEELSKVERTLIDAPDGGLLADILWSNPSKEDGLFENDDKQRGLSWGPDCTETFLKESNLKLIIRSHQSPDARAGQDDFGDLLSGYSEDHVGESGKLYTLFSAPDYPQFGEPKYNNEGAYAILTAPNFENPSFHTFKGVRPPKLTAYGSSSSSSQTSCPDWMLSKVDFEALGISNPPSWSVPIADNTGGTKSVEVPRAPSVEGLPLPSELQEPHKAAFEYLFELVAGLKYMVSTRASESRAPESAMEVSVPNANEGEIVLNENEAQNAPDEREQQSESIEMGECEEQNVVDEKEEEPEILSEKEEKENEMETEEEGKGAMNETQGQDGPSVDEEHKVVAETEGQDVETEKEETATEKMEMETEQEETETGKVETETENVEMETEKEKETETVETETEREAEEEELETEKEEEAAVNEEAEKEKEESSVNEKEAAEEEMETENEKEEVAVNEKEAEKEEMEAEKETEEKVETVCETEKEGQDVRSGNDGEKEEAQSVADKKRAEDVPKKKDEGEKLAEEAPTEKDESVKEKKQEETNLKGKKKHAEEVPKEKEHGGNKQAKQVLKKEDNDKLEKSAENAPEKKEEKVKKADVPEKKEEKARVKKADLPEKKEEKEKVKKADLPEKKEEKEKTKKQAEEVPKKKEDKDKGEKQAKDVLKEKEEKTKGKKQAEEVSKEKEEKDHKRKKQTEDVRKQESTVDDKEVKKTYRKVGKKNPNEDEAKVEEQGKAKKHKTESKPKE